MEIRVEEKPTGEIMAGAGVGTEGTSLTFSVKENNYLGKGLGVDATVNLTEESLRGGLTISDPNYKYTDNIVYGGLTSTNTERPDSGYENSLMTSGITTAFEQYKDVNLSIGVGLSYDDMQVSSTASDALKKQAGNFTDIALDYGIGVDKRDKSYMPTSGYISTFKQTIPVYARGQNIRDWIHVDDHCNAVYSALLHGKSGESYNISADNEIDNLTIVKKILLVYVNYKKIAISQ